MMAVAYVLGHLTVLDLSPAQICQLLYVLSAAAVLAVTAVPDTAQRLLTQYGARSSHDASVSTSSSHADAGRQPDDSTKPFVGLISCLTSIGKIPHSWFIHFYILSLLCTVFWAVQFAVRGSVLDFIVKSQISEPTPSMTMSQVILLWFLMGFQGARRLYECLAVLQPSSSRMWIIHWGLGNVFYLCTSVSLWVEGCTSIHFSFENYPNIEFPPSKSIIASLVFIIAWFMQYRCHRYLAGLKKYSLPNDGLFQYLVCPHYTCECLLYLSMAVAAAPEGRLYNRTLACAVLFVLVNLGVTANGTKQWYVEKFGSQVQRRWKMIPVVF